MNDEKHKPNEDWEMSVPNISSPEPNTENSGEWKMPEPTFRVSEGDNVEKPEIKPLAEEESLSNHLAPDEESFVLAQPHISEEFNTSEISEPSYQNQPDTEKSEDGNTKWVVLLGGIFIFFAVLIGIGLGVYFLLWK